MESVRIVFSRRHNIGSLLLRTFLWSDWSHCGVIDDETGEVIEAAFPGGVRFTPLKQFQEHASKFEIIEIPTTDARRVVLMARGFEGARYDSFGCLGIAFRRDWQDPTALFCSELVALAFHMAGYPLFRREAWRITPRDLYIRNY